MGPVRYGPYPTGTHTTLGRVRVQKFRGFRFSDDAKFTFKIILVVQQERDRCEIRFGAVNDELAQLRREMIQKTPKTQKESNLAQTAILKRIQTERDSALADLRRISCERDSLLEQVKINRENQMCDTGTV